MANQRPQCPVCQGPMKKNGTTSKGTTRWRCKDPHCNASTINTNPNTTRARTFQQFITWILSTTSLTHGMHRTTLAKKFTWCWLITPPTPKLTTPITQIIIDGTYFGKKKNKTCLLTATNGTHILAWHWCKTETKHDYLELLRKIPTPPTIVITDGNRGSLAAITTTWPTVPIQRCLFHVNQNITTLLTRNPRTTQGQALTMAMKKLLEVTNKQQRDWWLSEYNKLFTALHPWINQRTYATTTPTTTPRPAHVRPDQTWWYTHQKHRKAAYQLRKLANNGQLFAFLDAPDPTCPYQRTTSRLEGGINRELKRLAEAHRGQTREHLRIMVDWWCYLHTPLPGDPVTIARQQDWAREAEKIAKQLIAQENAPNGHLAIAGPVLYDRGIDPTPSNSMGIRRGWLGR